MEILDVTFTREPHLDTTPLVVEGEKEEFGFERRDLQAVLAVTVRNVGRTGAKRVTAQVTADDSHGVYPSVFPQTVAAGETRRFDVHTYMPVRLSPPENRYAFRIWLLADNGRAVGCDVEVSMDPARKKPFVSLFTYGLIASWWNRMRAARYQSRLKNKGAATRPSWIDPPLFEAYTLRDTEF